jgi:oxygen-dependent protoporphyrinogen oxidase
VKIAVVGGGISGLAAAWELRDRAETTLFEPSRVGGKLRTSTFAGAPVDEGADAFLTRVPEAVALCDELGLRAELVAPQAGRTMLWSAGRLHEIPAGLVLGVPRDLRPLLASRLLSPIGMARAAFDLVLPASRIGDDISVHDLVSRRFGPEVAARLVEPLIGSIHAARTADLGAAATVPQLLAAARRSRSLLLGLRREQGGAPAGPLFLAPRGGLSVLVETLRSGLEERGTALIAARVRSVVPAAGGGADVDGERFDGVVLTVPARTAATLLGDLAPEGLAEVPVTDVVLVTLDVPTVDLGVPPDVNGILVPPGEGTLMTACSFGSNKWPQWSARPGRSVIRVSAGRHGDRRPAELDDEALVNRLCDELGTAVRRPLHPGETRVSRWPGSFPLYRVGHLERVREIEARLERSFPAVTLAGSSYRGAGIPACIASGRLAAGALINRLGRTGPLPSAPPRRSPR